MVNDYGQLILLGLFGLTDKITGLRIMKQYYTTIAQSMKLLAKGIEPKTCDKSYWLDEQKQWQLKDEQDVAITHDLFSFRNHYVYPCQMIGGDLVDIIFAYILWLISNGYELNGNEPNN